MKVLRYLFVLIVIGLTTLALPDAEAVQFTPLSITFVHKLQADFSSAFRPDPQLLRRKNSWDCTLYGMRSRMETERKVNFYNFRQTYPNQNHITNSGSQVVTNYFIKSHALVGRIGLITDNIRMTSNGTLIGEMSLPRRFEKSISFEHAPVLRAVSNAHLAVLAYTLCR